MGVVISSKRRRWLSSPIAPLCPPSRKTFQTASGRSASRERKPLGGGRLISTKRDVPQPRETSDGLSFEDLPPLGRRAEPQTATRR